MRFKEKAFWLKQSVSYILLRTYRWLLHGLQWKERHYTHSYAYEGKTIQQYRIELQQLP